MNISEWQEQLEMEREQKDRFFLFHSQSPLPLNERREFFGLDYYPPDQSFRFELELHEPEEKETLKIEDTGGNEREFLRWGEFRFKVADEECKLQAYKSAPEEERLFVPFRDATSGKAPVRAGEKNYPKKGDVST